ncbi:hypothetical protein ULG90_10270 [Halopseudomonas pachastrellae]|nr:hypothetical protein ULG90_10270 [Halopseudomonas pachastrellae]
MGAVGLLLLTLAFELLLDWIIGLSLIAATSSLVLRCWARTAGDLQPRTAILVARQLAALPTAVPGPVAG